MEKNKATQRNQDPSQSNQPSSQLSCPCRVCQEHNKAANKLVDRSMDQPTDMETKDATTATATAPASPLERSLSAVTYCCGACGYDLRLRSSDRNTAGLVGAAYGRAARRGVVAFDAIDDARFGHADEFRCVDVRARRLFVRRTRLLCRKCGASLGFGYDDRARGGGSGGGRSPRYDIRIRALQPLADGDVGATEAPTASAVDA